MPPEQLLLASLLLVFYGIRSERLLLLEQLDDDFLFRWFVGQGRAKQPRAAVLSR